MQRFSVKWGVNASLDGRTFSKKRQINFRDLSVKPKDSLQMRPHNIARQIGDNNDFGIDFFASSSDRSGPSVVFHVDVAVLRAG
jgi:hypothetical protein